MKPNVKPSWESFLMMVQWINHHGQAIRLPGMRVPTRTSVLHRRHRHLVAGTSLHRQTVAAGVGVKLPQEEQHRDSSNGDNNSSSSTTTLQVVGVVPVEKTIAMIQ